MKRSERCDIYEVRSLVDLVTVLDWEAICGRFFFLVASVVNSARRFPHSRRRRWELVPCMCMSLSYKRLFAQCATD